MSADFWAGYVSGAAGIAIGNPMDLIKVRLQASSTTPKTSARLASSITQISGFREATRGLFAPVLTYGALNALLFTTYNRSLALLSPFTQDLSPLESSRSEKHPYWAQFGAGAISGLATFFISTPTEVVKCRTQVAQSREEISSANAPSQKRPPLTSLLVARSTFHAEGLRGFYNGGAVTSIRDALGYGFYFWVYEASKDLWEQNLAQWSNPSANDAAKTLLCGGMAGVATWASIFPLDVIKTRVQTQDAKATSCLFLQNHQTPSRVNSTRFKATVAARQAYTEQGLSVFFRGLGTCSARAFVVNAVQWAVYERMMAYLTDHQC